MEDFLSGSVELSIVLIIVIGLLYVTIKNVFKGKGILPFIGNIMGYFPTVVHEFGHVIGCKLMFGRVGDIVLLHTRKNQEIKGAYGYAVTYNKGRVARAFKAFLGYLAPPVLVYLIVYLNSVERVSVALIILLIGSLYLLIKTSNKLPVMVNMGVIGVITYVVLNEGILEGYGMVVVGITLSLLIGLLLGETVFSMINMWRMWWGNHTTWDGYVIKKEVLMPVILTIIAWYLSIGYILYLTIIILSTN